MEHRVKPEHLPEFIFNLPELQYPARLNCAAEFLDAALARGWRRRIALRTPEHACTYESLLAQANRIAHVLTGEMGLLPGQRVLLCGARDPMMAACWFAILRAGGVAVPVSPQVPVQELAQIVAKAGVTHALCDRRMAATLLAASSSCPPLRGTRFWNDDDPAALDALAARQPAVFEARETSADDLAMILFTEGASGPPRGTMHVHRDLLAACDLFPRSCLMLDAGDLVAGTLPLTSAAGLVLCLLAPLRHGACAMLIEAASPLKCLGAAQATGATVFVAGPADYARLLTGTGRNGFAAFSRCVSTGAVLPDAVRTAFRRAAGKEIIDGLGSTAMLGIYASHNPASSRRNAIGQAVPGYRVMVVDSGGFPCTEGQVGQLAVIGPTGMRYLDDELQKDAVAADGPAQRWNLTGDAGAMDEDGYIYLQSRLAERIYAGGFAIVAPEVEVALEAHPAVAQAAVTSAQDADGSRFVTAFVVLQPGLKKSASLVRMLQTHVQALIAPYKCPQAIEFVKTLPRTSAGRLQRYKLESHS